MKKTAKQKRREQRAVSPVIGVILMVAITVILAAVIGTFVLELGDVDEPAQAGFDISDDGDNVTIDLISTKSLDSWNVTGVDSGAEPVLVNGAEANTTGFATYLKGEGIVMIERAKVGDTLEWNYDNAGSQMNIVGIYQTEESVIQNHVIGG